MSHRTRSGRSVHDDLGHPVHLPVWVDRVVSLVPSLSESIAATRPEALIAVTDWCIQPPALDVTRIRGTKNPDTRVIIALAPDVVLANREENRAIDVKRLREAGIPVWVTDIESVPQALHSLERMFRDALGWDVPAWLRQAQSLWEADIPWPTHRVAALIWRDPWMAVGRDTFAGDVMARLGLSNAFGDHRRRYPQVDIEQLDRPGIDAVLLPDEPYPFTQVDGPDAFTHTPTILIDGRLLTWYGPSLIKASRELPAILAETLNPA